MMATAQADDPTRRKPLRLWPGVVLLVLQWLARFGVPVVAPEATPYGMLGGLACGAAILLWWIFLSRAPWPERLGVPVVMVAGFLAARPLLHESIATGAMGMLFPILVIPFLSLALVAWAVVSERLVGWPRWVALAALVLVACGGWTLVRTGGFAGDFDNDFAWRWTPTPEERLLARQADLLPAPADAPPASAAGSPEAESAAETEAIWPGFRGPGRDGVVRGVRIATDWSASPPVELWRRPVGPGWSSYAVSGSRIFTQEQRGEEEVVSCYDAATGEPVWRHGDAARFWESNAGAGPRGTPTLSDGRVYSLGATGILNALEAADGAVVWSRDAASDSGTKVPIWGYSGSPLVVDALVIVAVSGALAAYDLVSGDLRWTGPDGGESYSSPHLFSVDGADQVLLLSGAGAAGFAPADGTVLWEHGWKGFPIVQPAVTGEGDVLVSVAAESGLRRLAVSQGPGGWAVEERWTTNGLKPYFDDFVVHKGHAYGFDGRILAAIDLADGERKWKGGRYGNGQLVLLADQDLLLVLSEKGEIALVEAKPDGFKELARVPAIEGKTWNHPVLAGDLLLVRNAEEMAAFRLVVAES